MQQKTTTKFCLNICSSMLNVKILVCVGCLFLWFEVLNGSLLLQKRSEKIFVFSFARFFVGEHFFVWFGINQISPRLFSLLKFKRRAKWRTAICLVPFGEDKTLLWLATVWKFYFWYPVLKIGFRSDPPIESVPWRSKQNFPAAQTPIFGFFEPINPRKNGDWVKSLRATSRLGGRRFLMLGTRSFPNVQTTLSPEHTERTFIYCLCVKELRLTV